MAKKTGGNAVLWIMISIALVGVIGSGAWLFTEIKEYVSGKNEYSELASSFTAGGTVKKRGLWDTVGAWLDSNANDDEADMKAIMDAQAAAAMNSPAVPTGRAGGTITANGIPIDTGGAGESQQSTIVKPTLRVDFPALSKVNEDIIGWIYAEDTVIHYPVLQGKDNATYLKRLYDGTANKVGSIFLDAAAAADFSDTNSILYGHHMRDGSMFACLMGYKQQEYYDAHPTMELYTPAGNYTVALFSGYITGATAAQGCYQLSYETPEDYMNFIAEAKRKSTFKADVEVTQTDRIITLSTCTYETSDARYVVIGKLIPMEDANSDADAY